MERSEVQPTEPISPREFVTGLSQIYDNMPRPGTLPTTGHADIDLALQNRARSDHGRVLQEKVDTILRRTPDISDPGKDWVRSNTGFDYLMGRQLYSHGSEDTTRIFDPGTPLQDILKHSQETLDRYGLSDTEFFRAFERDCYLRELNACLRAEEMLERTQEEQSTSSQEKMEESESFVRRTANRIRNIVGRVRRKSQDESGQKDMRGFFMRGINEWRQEFIEKHNVDPNPPVLQ